MVNGKCIADHFGKIPKLPVSTFPFLCDAMDDSFRLRVNKIFGCLASSSSTTAPTSLWCLTDDEIERREWNRDKAIPEPQPPTRPGLFPAFFDGRRNISETNSIDCEDELQNDLDDDLEDEPRLSGSSLKSTKPDDYGEEEWEIKSSIGLDCTLDYEEEEDEYDKVAVGKEKAGDCLFMKDVTEYEINIDSSSILPNSANHFIRDPRANHTAAKLRLKEDAEAAEKLDSLQVSQKGASTGVEAVELNSSEIPKSILKRKDEQFSSKPLKRVRFDPECKNCTSEEEPEESKDAAMEILSLGSEAVSNQARLSQVPDYIRNPSRYTHYTFDSFNDVDEESNKKAYMDFLALVKRPQSSELQQEDAYNLPKGVTFIPPRKKTGDAVMIENITQNQGGAGKELVQQRSMPVSIAAGKTVNNSEVCDMDEDELEISDGRRNSSQKVGRQYRTRTKVDEND